MSEWDVLRHFFCFGLRKKFSNCMFSSDPCISKDEGNFYSSWEEPFKFSSSSLSFSTPPLSLFGWQRELDQHQHRAVEECDRVLAQVAAGEDGRGMDLSRTSTQCDHSCPAQSSPDSATPPNPAPGSGPASQRRPRKDATSPTAAFPPQVRVFTLSLSLSLSFKHSLRSAGQGTAEQS